MKKLKQKEIVKNKWGFKQIWNSDKGDSKLKSKIQCFDVSY